MTSVTGCLLTATLLFSLPAQPAGHHRHDRDRCEKHCQRSGDGDRKNNRYCFMPCDFVIIVPMPGQPGPDEQAALFPPQPDKVVTLIQAFAAGVGKSAGELAGAIAAFPPALLL